MKFVPLQGFDFLFQKSVEIDVAVHCFLGRAFDTADDEQPYGTVTAARSAHLFRPGSRNDGVGSVVADGGGLEIVLHRVSFENEETRC